MINNRDRADYGLRAVERGTPDYRKNGTDEEGLLIDVVDTLANIMHYCKLHDIAFDGALDSARMHFSAEDFNEQIEDGDL